MENFNFDDKYLADKSSLHHQFDNDEIWTNIEPKLKRKKKRRFIIWFFFGGLMLAGLAALWFLPMDNAEEYAVNTTSNAHLATAQALTKIKEDIPTLSENKIVVKSESTTTESKVIKSETSTKLTISLPAKKQTTTYVNPSVETVIPEATAQQPSLVKSNATIARNALDLVKQQRVLTGTNPILEVEEKQKVPTEVDLLVVENEVIAETVEEVIEEIAVTEKIFIQKEKIINAEKEVAPEQPFENETPIAAEVKKDRTKEKKNRAREKKRNSKEKAKKKSKKRPKRKMRKPSKSSKLVHAFKVSPGLYYGIESVSLPTWNMDNSYLDFRNENTNQTASYGLRTNYNLITPSGILFTTGLEFIQLNEKISREEVIVEKSNRSVVVSVVEDSEGQAIRSNTEMQSVTTTTTYTQRLNNQYFMLNVPVGIGMQSKLGKIRFSFSGGANYNLFTSFSGSIYNESRTLVNLVSGTSLHDNFLKNSTSWGLWTSFSFDRPISKNTSISLSVGLQAPLSKITEADFYYNQRLYITNLSLGFKYTLPTKSDSKSRNIKGKL